MQGTFCSTMWHFKIKVSKFFDLHIFINLCYHINEKENYPENYPVRWKYGLLRLIGPTWMTSNTHCSPHGFWLVNWNGINRYVKTIPICLEWRVRQIKKRRYMGFWDRRWCFILTRPTTQLRRGTFWGVGGIKWLFIRAICLVEFSIRIPWIWNFRQQCSDVYRIIEISR